MGRKGGKGAREGSRAVKSSREAVPGCPAFAVLLSLDIKNGGNLKSVSVSYYFPGYVSGCAVSTHSRKPNGLYKGVGWWRDREKPEKGSLLSPTVLVPSAQNQHQAVHLLS